jgi:tripartite-type tricarboxylate transporter receptor subunit TctC
MKRRSFVLGGAATFASALASPVARAQVWPAGQPIRFIVPAPAGGAFDLMARLAAQRVADKLKATVVVENKPGGSVLIGTLAALSAAPDGYTFLASAFNHILLNHVLPNVTFDPQADFEVVARTARTPLVMVMAPQRPERTLPEVVNSVRRNPSEWNVAVPTLGAAGHLATLEFMRRLGIRLTVSPYRGTAPALTDVMGGHVQLMIDASPALMPAALDGKVRALGILSRERSSLAPNIPTMTEGGLADFESQSWYGLWAPKGTPLEIRQRVNDIMREAMADPEILARLGKSLLEPVLETIDEARAFIAADVSRQVALLKSFDFQPQ